METPIPDIAIAWDTQNACGDWTLAGGDLVTGPSIESAVAVSLFTDRRAAADYVPLDGSGDLRGFWADTYSDGPWGSRLWQLRIAVKTDQTKLLLQAQDICQEALAWLVKAGAVAAVDVAASWLNATDMGLLVTVTKPDGSTQAFTYSWAWKGV